MSGHQDALVFFLSPVLFSFRRHRESPMTGAGTSRRVRWVVGVGTVLVLTAAVAWMSWRAWGQRVASGLPGPDAASLEPDTAPIDAQTESQIAAFCGDCHAVPRPESFPRDRWHQEVRLGYEYYARSGRNDLAPPPIVKTVAYYRSRAPQRLVFGRPTDSPSPLRAAFVAETLDWDRKPGVQAATSHLGWRRLGTRGDPVLLVSDMRDGSITAVDLRHRPSPPRLLARLRHPCHVEPCDLEGNSMIGLVVADLGSFAAVDHAEGRVVWLRPQPDTGAYEPVVIASGLGRVADVRPVDVDRDGDLDLIVAEFGHRQTGGILLLRNVAARGPPQRFELEKLH
jgi:hypothetical protein